MLFTKCCTFCFFILSIFISSSVVFAATIFVPGDYATIQDALDAAVSGDIVLVADGTYSGNILFPGNKTNITLISEHGPDSTVIEGAPPEGAPEGDPSGSVVTFSADNNFTLEGFTITKGSTSGNGGGVLIGSSSSPTITNCIITNNRASSGGGITVGSFASPTITNCIITNNEASVRGGGITLADSSAPFIDNCTISNNLAPQGGGISVGSFASPTIDNCIITNNEAFFGGGISCGGSSAPFITNSIFQNNSATGDTVKDNGGGLHAPIIINCIFKDNTSNQNGGGMAFDSAEPLIVNCTFDNNTAALSGGAISLHEAAPIITNCSFSNNSALTNPGGAIACNNPSPETTVTNSIFWGDHPAEIACDANTISVTYSNIQGGGGWPANPDMAGADRWPGTGNINADPRFLDQANGDFHLTNDSPCIDAGDNSDPYLQTTDIDGDDRKIDDPAVADTGNGTPPIVDMGAFEKYLDVESPPPIKGGNEWTPPGGGPPGGGCPPPGGGDPPPGGEVEGKWRWEEDDGIFGDILKSSVVGYHLDGWTAEGIGIYMPVTRGFKALKGVQEYVRNFAPNLARIVSEVVGF
jgi:parallel beta-helix repeat protein/predicted outer membrane repeat protein